MQRIMRGPDIEVGNRIMCDGDMVAVTKVIWHKPYTHDRSPIQNDLVAQECVTRNGSRWYGYTP
jgi:hypothetical protein